MGKIEFYTRKKTVGGVEYTAQFSGISTAIRASDSCSIEGTSATSTEKYSKFLFEHVIVEPKGLTADDFDNIDDFNAVTVWARDVMQGKFRDEPDAGTTEKAGK